MSKSNGTAASQANAPEDKPYIVDQPHSRNYPGKKGGKKEANSGTVSHDAAALARARGQVMGTSKNGSHLSLPSTYNYIGHDGYNVQKEAGITSPEQSNDTPKHQQDKVVKGRKASLGDSANGSHKGLPVKYEVIKQKGAGQPDGAAASQKY